MSVSAIFQKIHVRVRVRVPRTIFGKKFMYFQLKDFVSDEIPMFHNVEFQEASGSDKRILEFCNQKGDRLLETNVSEESFGS